MTLTSIGFFYRKAKHAPKIYTNNQIHKYCMTRYNYTNYTRWLYGNVQTPLSNFILLKKGYSETNRFKSWNTGLGMYDRLLSLHGINATQKSHLTESKYLLNETLTMTLQFISVDQMRLLSTCPQNGRRIPLNN